LRAASQFFFKRNLLQQVQLVTGEYNQPIIADNLDLYIQFERRRFLKYLAYVSCPGKCDHVEYLFLRSTYELCTFLFAYCL
jgi:hypothetical protein